MKPFDASELLNISHLSAHLKKIEAGLIEATLTDNPALHIPLSRLVRAGSKRLRSTITLAIAASQDKEINETVISGCVAIELVHIGSLIHDDIIDSADTRWGIQTVNSKEGVNQAILVGDFLFAKAGVIAASISADAAGLISSTIVALVDGESREVADEFNQERTIESLDSAIRGKTAALVSAACQMGGLTAGLEKGDVLSLAKFGESFGMAFQIIDDVLDFVSSDKLMGKPVGNDVKEGVYTLPLLLALRSDGGGSVRELLDRKPADKARLRQLLVEGGHIEHTLIRARSHNKQAQEALRDLPGTSGLAKFPDKYMQWALDNLVDIQ